MPTAATRCSSTAGDARPGRDPAAWARELARARRRRDLPQLDRPRRLGAGYDLELIARVTDAVDDPGHRLRRRRPLRALSPARSRAGAAAAAAANIFHFFELSYRHAKQRLPGRRRPDAAGATRVSRWLPREPAYDRAAEDARIAAAPGRCGGARLSRRAARAAAERRRSAGARAASTRRSRAAPMEFDDARRLHRLPDGGGEGRDRAARSGRAARELLRDLLERYRCRDGSRHDCVIAVSGGKDSYFQTHVHQARARPQPAARHLQRQQLDRRSAGATCCA